MVSQFRKSPLALLVTSFVSAATFTTASAQQVDIEGHEHEDTEVIVVTASPLNRTVLNSAQPISVLAGDQLREQQAHTLGETLAHEPGINATHFAGVASSPIVRGLDGPRVKITQNGLDTGDVSRGSPDHAVTTETSVAEQIEIFRGPATLLYGSGAIGGVVNVVDNRIAQELIGGTKGFYGTTFDTASNLREATVGFSADHNNTVWHFDGFKRRSDDYDVPKFVNDEGETTTSIENSFIDAQGANLGLSYIFDKGFVGVSYGRLEQQYGIPGHHAHEDEHADEEVHQDEVAEAGPFADMWQNRVQVRGAMTSPTAGIERLELSYGFTDYQHQEIEDNAPSTTFTNNQHELRITANHAALAGWTGAFGYHYFDQAQTAFGEEAYTPNSDTTKHGVFWLLERDVAEFNWQVGARIEDVEINDYSFSPLSASVGFTYPFATGMQLSANVSHAQRAPSANELFSNGAHLATQTYEIGLTYALHPEDEHAYHLEAADQSPQVEKSNNLDLGLHLDFDRFHMDWNLFYNQVDDFVFGEFTGINSLDIEQPEEHADEHAHDDIHDHEDGLPVIAYTQRDVALYGFELSGYYELTSQLELHAFSDFVKAKTRDNNENLPRIPSQRIGTELRYAADQWESKLGYTWYNKQTFVAPFEDQTDSFGLLNAQVNWFPRAFANHNISIYLKGENLTDELAFVHTSFLKDDAPMRGRNFSIGLRGEF